MTLREMLEKKERYWRREKYEFPTFSPMYEQCHGYEMAYRTLLKQVSPALLSMEVQSDAQTD